MDLKSIAIGTAIGKQVLLDEHHFFVEEWMKPLAGDDEVPSEAEALAEFERYLRERRR
jgi:hypothetical protein